MREGRDDLSWVVKGRANVLKKVRHIGIIAEDFERTIEKFKGFGLQCTELIENKQMGLKIAFFPIGNTVIELICQEGLERGQDEVFRIVSKQKGNINHICFEVDNLEVTIKDFERNGARLIEGCPAAGAHGRVAFFYPDTTEGVLIEICELQT
jgi:methylmalonyl-CoA/ethylmalonyl-CoA epimerase